MGRYEDKDGRPAKRARKPGTLGESYDAVFRGYINLNLSADQKASFEPWSEGASPMEVLQASVEDGINISLKLEAKSGGYLASATQRRVSSPNAGLVVTARAGGAAKALLRLLFCLVLLSHSERWEVLAPMSDPDRW